MNSYLLGLITKWISILCVSFAGLLNIQIFKEETFEIKNPNQTKNLTVEVKQLDYEIEKTYNDKIPNDVVITKQEGQKGLAYVDDNNNIVETIKSPITEILEVGTGSESEYVGKLTGYGADCQGCSGKLYCKTKTGNSWNLNVDGEIYQDDEYGSVRILAASINKFPCGTIIKVENSNLGNFNAVVMDTGSSVKKAYEQGIIHMDLAFVLESSADIYKATGFNIKYTVQRWGW